MNAPLKFSPLETFAHWFHQHFFLLFPSVEAGGGQGSDAGAKTPAEIALVAIVGVLALLRGRGKNAGSDVTKGVEKIASPAAPIRSDTQDEKFINPVCGMAVSIANPKHVERYEEVSYYFCCDGCLTTFQKEPAKYAAIHHVSIGRVPA